MNKVITLIQQGAARLNIRPSLAVKSEVSKRRLWLRQVLQERELEVSNGRILVARAAVILVGLYVAAVGASLLVAGCINLSWGSIVVGLLVMAAFLFLAWTGVPRKHNKACKPTVVLVVELLARILG